MSLFGMMVTAALLRSGLCAPSCGGGACPGFQDDETNLMQVKNVVNSGKLRTVEHSEEAISDRPPPGKSAQGAQYDADTFYSSQDAQLARKAEMRGTPPGWLQRGLGFLDSHLDHEGLWRGSGSKVRIAELVKDNLAGSLSPPVSANDVAGALVRKLKQEVLIPHSAFFALLHAGQHPDDYVPTRSIKKALATLDPQHLQILNALFHHFHLVFEHEANNRMSLNAISTCAMGLLIGEKDQDLYSPYDLSLPPPFVKEGEAKMSAENTEAEWKRVLEWLVADPDAFF